MSQAFLRNLRYQGRSVLISLACTAATLVLMLVWAALTTPVAYLAENLAIMSLGALLFSAFIWAGSVYMMMYATTLPLVLSYSTTRKASFWGCQAGKLLYALGVGVMGLICAVLVRIIVPELWSVGLTVAVLAVFIVLLLASLMELTGFIIRRFGKLGVVIYALLCGALGAGVGVGVAMSGADGLAAKLYTLLAGLPSGGLLAVCCGALLALAGICTVITGVCYRKMSV